MSGSNARATLRKVLLTLEVGLTVILADRRGPAAEELRAAALHRHGLHHAERAHHAARASCVPATKRPRTAPTSFDALLDASARAARRRRGGDCQSRSRPGLLGRLGIQHRGASAASRIGKGLFAINRWADPKYFAAIGIPFLRGRTFDDGKDSMRRTKSSSASRSSSSFSPAKTQSASTSMSNSRTACGVIVGVVGDTRYVIGEEPLPMQYYPLDAGVDNNGTLVVRSSHDVEQLAMPVQRMVGQLTAICPSPTCSPWTSCSERTPSTRASTPRCSRPLRRCRCCWPRSGCSACCPTSSRSGQPRSASALRWARRREQVMRKMLIDGMGPAVFGLAWASPQAWKPAA